MKQTPIRKTTHKTFSENLHSMTDNSSSSHSNEGLYVKMIDEVRDYAILLLDLNGNILSWNLGAKNIKGYEPDEIIGKNFRCFYSTTDQNTKLPESLLEKAKTDGRVQHEGWRIKKDGSSFWGSVVITAMHGDDNEIVGYSKLTRDLTERKTAEERLASYAEELKQNNEKLRQSEERYQRMITEVEDYAIILLDTEGNILNWNKGAEKIKGYTEAEIINKSFKNFYLEEDQKNNLPTQLLNLAAKNNKASHEGWRVRKDGTRFWGNVVITALHDTQNNIIGYSKVTRDLTQRKQFEDQILMQNKQLEEYAYVASHDLQEPLRKILIFGDFLERAIEGNDAANLYMQKIKSSAHRMGKLVKSILMYSQARNTKELLGPTDLNEIMGNIENDFEMLLNERNGVIKYEPLPVLQAIPIQMHQLFSNLIHNAIKFNSNAPEIFIAAKTTTSGNHDDLRQFVKITVSDNGIGFDQELEDKIFKMFHRLHDNKTGTGIGLALCKKIVENHGGTIHATSHSGKGTIFEIVLPLD